MNYHPDNTLFKPHQLQACPQCDLLMARVIPTSGEKCVCPRCGCILSRHKNNSITRSLALGLCGLFLYFPAILLPLMTFKKLGLSDTGNIVQTIIEFYSRDYFLVAAIVFFSAVLFPFMKLSLLVSVALCIKIKRFPTILPRLFRIYTHMEDWAMAEVFLLGIMVTIIKMYHSTDIIFNTGFFCFISLVIVTMASAVTVSKNIFWNCIEKGQQQGSIDDEEIWISPAHTMTAKESHLIVCRDCSKLLGQDIANKGCHGSCPRCSASLHQRKPASISRTWALVITAAILLIPANTLPIMRVEFLGIPSNSTILDGIRLFFEDGSFAIALIILVASILIPIFKITGLVILLATIHLKSTNYLRQKTTMFKIIEFIGRWSMLDIFVIAILGVFVNFGFLTSIETAPAATYFCLVVVTTMLAALTFDTRIMWDSKSNKQSPTTGE